METNVAESEDLFAESNGIQRSETYKTKEQQSQFKNIKANVISG